MKKQAKPPCNYSQQDKALLQVLRESRLPNCTPPQTSNRVASHSVLQRGRHIPLVVDRPEVRWPFQFHRGVDADLQQLLNDSRSTPDPTASPRPLRLSRSTPLLVARAALAPPVPALPTTVHGNPTFTLNRPGGQANRYPVPRGVPRRTSRFQEQALDYDDNHSQVDPSEKQALRTKRSIAKVNKWLNTTQDNNNVTFSHNHAAREQPHSVAVALAAAGRDAGTDEERSGGGEADREEAGPAGGGTGPVARKSRNIVARGWRWMFL